MDQATFEEMYEDWHYNTESKDRWYNHIPVVPIVCLTIAALLIVIVLIKSSSNVKIAIVIGSVLAVAIILALRNKSGEPKVLSEGQAIDIVRNYISVKSIEIPSLYKKKWEIGTTAELQQWDIGEGMKAWRWCIPWYVTKSNIKLERYCTYLDPFTGIVTGTERLDKEFIGNEKPNIKIHYNLKDRLDAKFKMDVMNNRSKW